MKRLETWGRLALRLWLLRLDEKKQARGDPPR